MKKITLGISVLALALAGAAIAAEAPMHHGMDKTMTRAEAKAHAEEAFAKLDVNHDGKLDKADRTARFAAHFDEIDTNHDGTISRDEFIAAHEAMGRRMGDEGQEGHEGRGPHGMGEHGKGRPRMGQMGMHGGRMPMMMEILHLADPNHTGTVTKDAFVAAALTLFDKADTNHDGKVTPEERKAAFAKQRAEMRAEFAKHGGMMQHGMGGDMPPPPPAH
jgi:Ca2+-binding EF-hand superfamily protein